MQNKKWDKIERNFDKHRKDDWHYCDVNNVYTKKIKQFFKKQFQNQRQEFMDIVEKVDKREPLNEFGRGRCNACQEILKELNK